MIYITAKCFECGEIQTFTTGDINRCVFRCKKCMKSKKLRAGLKYNLIVYCTTTDGKVANIICSQQKMKEGMELDN